MALRMKEQNGILCDACPHCGRLYPKMDEKGQGNELPSKCKRCGCPMDSEKALVFGEQQAKKEHIPALTNLGNAMRARGQAPAER